jgi:hypothetical protein
MNDIPHLRAFCGLTKMVLMVPESVGTQPLLINKQLTFYEMSDLGNPGRTNSAQRSYLLGDDHSGINIMRRVGWNNQIQ